MKITKLKLFTNKLELEKKFYSQTLGFDLTADTPFSFSVKIGWSELTFEKDTQDYKYHYCFLIPSNKLNQGMEWLQQRVQIIDIENGRKTQVFENWNAESVYFFDKSGNLAEFIVRYDLKNENINDFDIHQILGINEIGMPSKNITEANRFLEETLKTKFWKGDYNRFGTNGSQEGLFLIPNYKIKDIWFPTTLKIEPAPFEATIVNDGVVYNLDFKDETLNIKTRKN